MRAYITLLSTTNYLPGVISLARSLQDVNARFPLFVGLSAGVPAAIDAVLQSKGMMTVRLAPESPLPRMPDQKHHHWTNTFDKLHLFGLTDFDKLVYLDSDMMILGNIDELFEKPHMSAVAAGRLVHSDWTGLNSGLMVIEPRAGLPALIGKQLQPALNRALKAGRTEVGDQDLLNEFYANWPTQPGLHLDDGYNVFHYHTDAYIEAHNYALPSTDQADSSNNCKPIKVMHFVGRVKPWMAQAVAKHALGTFKPNRAPWERQAFVMYRKLLAKAKRPTFAEA